MTSYSPSIVSILYHFWGMQVIGWNCKFSPLTCIWLPSWEQHKKFHQTFSVKKLESRGNHVASDAYWYVQPFWQKLACDAEMDRQTHHYAYMLHMPHQRTGRDHQGVPVPRITWLKTIQRDLRAYNLTLNEAVDLAQNCPLWRLMSTYGATHSYWCMPEKKKTQCCWLYQYLVHTFFWCF